MNARFEDILNGLPEKPPRSRLEPFRELIGELRRRDRTYREIASILAEKCQLQAAPNTIHDFVRMRSLGKRKPTARAASGVAKKAQVARIGGVSTSSKRPNSSSGAEVQQKIAMLKARKIEAKATVERFQFDPTEPLRLKKSRRKTS
jgi:hypothetical protein